MAYIHNTTMSPTKVELLEQWLPEQPWYAGTGQPDLTRVGGFRLDDPDGEVGIEFLFVHDAATGTTYHVPMTYRGAPLPSGDAALIGTAEHDALGKRWIYDGTQDPVLMAQLAALLHGAAQPQHQSKSDTPDPTVEVVNAVTGDPQGEVRVVRVLGDEDVDDRAAAVTAPWRTPDDDGLRGRVVVVD